MKWLSDKGRIEWLGAGVLIAIGAFTIWEGMRYSTGTLARMGPGYFPVALGAILILLGVLVALTGDTKKEEAEALKEENFSNEWRGWGCIIAGIVAFIVLGGLAGLAPATFGLVFIAALGDKEHTLTSAALLASGTTVVGAIIFRYFLELQFPLFRWGW